jgi:hypothetical protein
MHRTWQRLVACLSLMAFLCANSQMACALPHAWFCSCRSTSPSSSVVCEAAAPGPSCCKHCAARKAPPIKSEVVQEQASDDQPAPDQSDPPLCPTCPCPGGCAYCNLAKIPCLLSSELLTVLVPCLDQGHAEGSLLIPPAPCGKLIRPPRA